MIPRYRYAETLEKKIKKYCNKFGINNVFCSDSFVYYPKNKTIYFTVYRYVNDENLIEFINKKYNVDISDWFFIFSLLHEIGHHKTMHKLTKADINYEMSVNDFLSFCDEDEKTKNLIHFNLPAEDLADRWAIDYIKNNLDECWNFQQKCLKIIEHIYNKKCFTY